MKRSLKMISLTLTSFLWLTNQAQAIPITINFTADNIVDTGGLCLNSDCTNSTGWSDLGTLVNLGNWKKADSIVIDLAPGTYSFAWGVVNSGSGSGGNPAGLLAEILWQGNTNSSSADWEVTINWPDTSSWFDATSYGNNGGSNIWTTNNGGAVAGIGSDAEWIWTDSNFGRGTDETGMDQAAWFRTSITVTSVPEPSTLALLGLGLLGLGLCRRRKA